jgi:hypothetical protein
MVSLTNPYYLFLLYKKWKTKFPKSAQVLIKMEKLRTLPLEPKQLEGFLMIATKVMILKCMRYKQEII